MPNFRLIGLFKRKLQRGAESALPWPYQSAKSLACLGLMYTVASPDPNPRGGGQLPNPNECSSMLTSATRGAMLTPKPNECKSTLTSGTRGIENTKCRFWWKPAA